MTQRSNVLVVDDEPPLRKVLQTSLTARGFAVEEAGSAERALELVAQRPFDIVLLDISMPGSQAGTRPSEVAFSKWRMARRRM